MRNNGGRHDIELLKTAMTIQVDNILKWIQHFVNIFSEYLGEPWPPPYCQP